MKKNILAGLLFCIAFFTHAQEYEHHFLLAGASFAVPENGWFELVCEAFNAEAMNKAVSGDAIKHTASAMFDNTFYTTEELERTDAFIIMHVHNQDVANTDGIKENYEDYTYDEIQQYHLAYDYVIKKYKADCYNLKNNPDSKYYQTENGKPATILLCTHWHDSRTTYNQSIRTLAERWQLPLVKWDENIGFTRKEPDPDGQQPSIKYSCDTETIYRITFGWHPLRGKEQYIQQKMAQICMEELAKLFEPVAATAKISEKTKLVASKEDDAYVIFTFTGVPPWNLAYSVNGQEMQLNDILENPQIVQVKADTKTTIVRPVSVSNANTENGEVSGETCIRICDQSILPFFDTYIHQANKTNNYATENHLEVKGNSDTHTRESFLSFATDGINPNAGQIILRAYYYDCIYPGWPRKETHYIEIAGNTEQYPALTWETKPGDFTVIGEKAIYGNELNSYIDWDVTEWTKQQIAAGKNTVTFRLRFGNTDGSGLLYFHSAESEQAEKPQLLIYSGQAANNANTLTVPKISAIAANNEIIIKGIESPCRLSCHSLCGQTLFAEQITANKTIKLPDCLSGIYVLQLHNGQQQYACKIVL